MNGYFITFEGGEGAGKSTQAQLLSQQLIKKGFDVLLTREPGGTKGAEAIRKLLLFEDCHFSLPAEIMAHFTARCDHVTSVIKPAIAQGKIVICDRYIDSTLAYQGYGISQEDQTIFSLIQKLTDLIALQPQLTLIFDASYELMAERCHKRQGVIDHYEKLDIAFHQRVIKGFQTIAKNNSDRCVIVDANQSLSVVQENVYNIVVSRLSEYKL